MALSSVSVVVSSLLLKFWRRPSWMNVERLEKELRSGAISPAGVAHRGNARKGSWWASTNIFSDSPRSLRRRVGNVFSSLWSLVTGKGPMPAGRGDEGYVPLQTVEPPV